MHRRSFLIRAGVAGVAIVAIPTARASAANPHVQDTALAELRLTVRDAGFDPVPDLPAGRYRVTVTNAGTLPTHSSIGRLPDGLSDADLALLFDEDESNDPPLDFFRALTFVGLPDWPAPGTSRSGIVDLPGAGRYVLFDPISARKSLVFRVSGTAPTASEPEVDGTVTLKEMALEFSPGPVTTGPKRWRMVNAGALVHEMAVLPLPAGTTEGQFGEYLTWTFSQPFDATPIPDATPPRRPRARLRARGRDEPAQPWAHVLGRHRSASRPVRGAVRRPRRTSPRRAGDVRRLRCGLGCVGRAAPRPAPIFPQETGRGRWRG